MSDPLQPQFAEVLTLIKTAQQKVIATANQELIKLYWSETYPDAQITTALRTQLSWTHHSILISHFRAIQLHFVAYSINSFTKSSDRLSDWYGLRFVDVEVIQLGKDRK